MAQNVTVGALSFQILADTDRFESDIKATRTEIRKAGQEMRRAQAPVEKYSDRIEELNRLYQKKLINQRAYDSAMKREIKAYQQAERAASRYGRVMARISKFGGGIGGRVAGAVGAAVTVAGIKRLMDDVDRNAKAARRLGMSYNQMQSIQMAASEASGMGGDAVNMAMQRMTRRVSEAAAGRGEARGALSALGLDAASLNAAGPAAAFKQIADQIRLLPTEADRLAIAFKLFDSEGAALVETLNMGSAGIEEFEKKAQELGMTLSAEQVAEIEAANDAMYELIEASKGLATSLTVILAPAMKIAAEAIAATGKGIRDWYTQYKKDVQSRWASVANWWTGTGNESQFRLVGNGRGNPYTPAPPPSRPNYGPGGPGGGGVALGIMGQAANRQTASTFDYSQQIAAAELQQRMAGAFAPAPQATGPAAQLVGGRRGSREEYQARKTVMEQNRKSNEAARFAQEAKDQRQEQIDKLQALVTALGGAAV